MSIPNEGVFKGTVRSAYVEEGYSAGELTACFVVEMDGYTEKAVTCKHACQGEYVSILAKIFELLELPWPAGLRDLEPCVGRACEVKIKHREPGKKGAEFKAYIHVYKDKARAEPSAIETAIAKLEAVSVADDSEIPF